MTIKLFTLFICYIIAKQNFILIKLQINMGNCIHSKIYHKHCHILNPTFIIRMACRHSTLRWSQHIYKNNLNNNKSKGLNYFVPEIKMVYYEYKFVKVIPKIDKKL